MNVFANTRRVGGNAKNNDDIEPILPGGDGALSLHPTAQRAVQGSIVDFADL